MSNMSLLIKSDEMSAYLCTYQRYHTCLPLSTSVCVNVEAASVPCGQLNVGINNSSVNFSAATHLVVGVSPDDYTDDYYRGTLMITMIITLLVTINTDHDTDYSTD